VRINALTQSPQGVIFIPHSLKLLVHKARFGFGVACCLLYFLLFFHPLYSLVIILSAVIVLRKCFRNFSETGKSPVAHQEILFLL
jgi:hypothetical protein